MYWRSFIGACLIVLSTSALAGKQEDDLRKQGFIALKGGTAIRRAFSGHTFSDDIHFSYDYHENGSIDGMGMGVRHRNSWVVEEDQLCVIETDGRSCYGVWKKGEEVKLVLARVGLMIEGFLRRSQAK